jgi:hypothetical protein
VLHGFWLFCRSDVRGFADKSPAVAGADADELVVISLWRGIGEVEAGQFALGDEAREVVDRVSSFFMRGSFNILLKLLQSSGLNCAGTGRISA